MKRQLEIYSYIIYNVDDGEDEKMCEFVVYLSNNKKNWRNIKCYIQKTSGLGSVQFSYHLIHSFYSFVCHNGIQLIINIQK